MIRIPKACEREFAHFPEEFREDLADLLARFDAGLSLRMPVSRPMPGVGFRVHELRLKHRSGAYRVFYALDPGVVTLFHVFRKSSEQTPNRILDLVKRRLREVRR